MTARLLVALLLAAPLLAEEFPDGPMSPNPHFQPKVEAPEVPAVVAAPLEKETGDVGQESDKSRKGAASPAAGGSFDSSKYLFACLAVGLLLGLGVWMLKRVFPSRLPAGSGALLEVLARTPVGPKQSVVLLRVAGRVLVVGVGPESLNTLSEISDAAEVEKLLLQPPKPPAGDFRARLTGVLAPFRGAPMGAFGEAGKEAAVDTNRMQRVGREGDDGMEDEIRALGRRVASWRVEDGGKG